MRGTGSRSGTEIRYNEMEIERLGGNEKQGYFSKREENKVDLVHYIENLPMLKVYLFKSSTVN